MEFTTLNNGVKMPSLGYGVYQVDPAECERCVLDAISVGYRSIDTAQAYYNEEGVGAAIQKSGVKREELFLTSKICRWRAYKNMPLRQSFLSKSRYHQVAAPRRWRKHTEPVSFAQSAFPTFIPTA